MNKIQKVFCCGGEQKKLRHKKDVQVTALHQWLDLLAESRVDHENLERNTDQDVEQNTGTNTFDVSRTKTRTSFSAFQTRRQHLHRQMTQRLRKRYLKSHLFLFRWRIKLPDTSGKHREQMRLTDSQLANKRLGKVKEDVVGQISRFQKGVRKWLKERKLIRQEEFSAWYSGMKRARHALAGLAAIQLLYIQVVGLAVSLAFSYAFSVEECWAWLSAVGKSVLMQLFVTDPVLGVVMPVSKLLMGWLLLRCEIRAEWKRRVQMLDEREKELELSEVKSVNNTKVVNAKLEALKVVTRGDEQIVRNYGRSKGRRSV